MQKPKTNQTEPKIIKKKIKPKTMKNPKSNQNRTKTKPKPNQRRRKNQNQTKTKSKPNQKR